MTFGSLFAGIGGFDLGLERAGMECRWQVEIDPFCRKVLARHWPDVTRYEDVRDVGFEELWPVDLVCGGFPCQDISSSGAKTGIEGERSGLWTEYARIVRELRPRYVVVENVADIVHRGMGDVLGTLAALRYDATWDVLPACAFGSPQRRERMFIVAHARRGGREGREERYGEGAFALERDHHDGLALDQRRAWDAASRISRVDDGVPDRVDRLRALGNAVVPQVAEWIGRAILEADA